VLDEEIERTGITSRRHGRYDRPLEENAEAGSYKNCMRTGSLKSNVIARDISRGHRALEAGAERERGS
jgi:hypothetical protein